MEVVLFNTCTSKLKKHVFCCGFKGKISSLRGFNTNFKYKVSRCFGGLGFYFLRNCSLREQKLKEEEERLKKEEEERIRQEEEAIRLAEEKKRLEEEKKQRKKQKEKERIEK